ncbi:glycoside hydrolase family 3 protein [Microbacterium sp. VKM Ac-2923]|uniref:glycoside hydrolase family 3 protein n=1 Tax=Microbacterium sp. VKM Ac-2923 TaxID=2929476 RepID=UPI001FB45EB8|nr:glycoside hydrolase family 3 N-terminal domain-containing protein [Microbacterium sp. VKM Ac-2923]MCJ1708765.1 glycoside hydrolase family 3 C-terminal domain-containing protein [Microbacterium sp. VKM Ac-2923]
MTTTQERVDAALERLSFTQRVGQLNQRLLGWNAVERRRDGFVLSDEGRREIDRWGGLGALYGLFRADAWSGRQWHNGIRPEERAEVAALVQDEVRRAGGVGVLLSEEAPHGHQALGGTILPAALSMAATFDPSAVRDASAAVAAQLAASGVHLALVSTLDLLRDPRWGRGEECFGEDPFLASAMTTAVVEGMQGPDSRDVGGRGVAVVLKHLAAQGEAMGGRNGQSTLIGPRDLEELHLPMVAAGVRAGAHGFMAAYNDIDGVPCCANRALLHDTLRERFGFDGIVMADGLAVDRLVSVTGSVAGAGRLALLSGVDLSLWDEGFATLDSAEDDPDVRAAVDTACRRILTLKERFGLLDDRAPAAHGDLRESIRLGERASRRLADACLVLLDDGGTLPWSPDRLDEVVVVGAYADEPTAMLGDYVAPLENAPAGIVGALRDALPGTRVRGAMDEDAAAAARDADAVVVVVGGTSHRSYDDEFASNGALDAPARATSGEGVDLADLDLPADQLALLRRVVDAARGPVAAVVVAGRPHVLTPLVDAGVAILWAGYPGPYGGEAIADALLGHRSPTGRLPFTSVRAGGAAPLHHNDRHDASGVYRDVPDPVLFPFGAGRGYREATLEGHRASVVPTGVDFSVRAHNPHAEAVDVVIPVYVRRQGGVVLPRRRELAALVRDELQPGETRTLRAFLDAASVRASPPAVSGRLRVTVGDWTTELDLPARL